MRRRQVTDNDLVLEFADVFRSTGSLRAAVVAAVKLGKWKKLTVSRAVPPAVLETASHFSVLVEDILGEERHACYADPRHVAMWVSRQQRLSYPVIGHAFGRDHTTVRDACKRVERSSELRAAGESILARIEANKRRLADVLDREAA